MSMQSFILFMKLAATDKWMDRDNSIVPLFAFGKVGGQKSLQTFLHHIGTISNFGALFVKLTNDVVTGEIM